MYLTVQIMLTTEFMTFDIEKISCKMSLAEEENE